MGLILLSTNFTDNKKITNNASTSIVNNTLSIPDVGDLQLVSRSIIQRDGNNTQSSGSNYFPFIQDPPKQRGENYPGEFDWIRDKLKDKDSLTAAMVLDEEINRNFLNSHKIALIATLCQDISDDRQIISKQATLAVLRIINYPLTAAYYNFGINKESSSVIPTPREFLSGELGDRLVLWLFITPAHRALTALFPLCKKSLDFLIERSKQSYTTTQLSIFFAWAICNFKDHEDIKHQEAVANLLSNPEVLKLLVREAFSLRVGINPHDEKDRSNQTFLFRKALKSFEKEKVLTVIDMLNKELGEHGVPKDLYFDSRQILSED